MSKVSIHTNVTRSSDSPATKKLLRDGGVEVGVLAGTGKHGDSDATTAEIAIWQELGTWAKTGWRSGGRQQHIPPRPFIQSTMTENREKYARLMARLIKLVLSGKLSQSQAAGLLGGEMQADIQAKIVAIDTPPNAPSTVAQKGSSNPLVDEGSLKQSIKWVEI